MRWVRPEVRSEAPLAVMPRYELRSGIQLTQNRATLLEVCLAFDIGRMDHEVSLA